MTMQVSDNEMFREARLVEADLPLNDTPEADALLRALSDAMIMEPAPQWQGVKLRHGVGPAAREDRHVSSPALEELRKKREDHE